MKKFLIKNLLTGITLMEVLVSMTILVIIIRISYSSLTNLQIETRRQEAHSELIKLKSSIEQIAMSGFVGSKSVNTFFDVATIFKEQQKKLTSPNGYYILKVSESTSNSYTLMAEAADDVTKSKDLSCKTITLKITAGSEDERNPSTCW